MPLRIPACRLLALALFAFIALPNANAQTTTDSGTFAADNSVFSVPFTTSGTESYTFETTSYASGGFVPALTLFSSSGPVIGFDGADGMCGAGMSANASTGICDDALLQETLPAGSYVLDLTEFPNVAIGDLSDGFVFASDPTATGDVCSVPGGMFLQSDLASCVPLSDAYSLNITSAAVTATPTPEPSTLLLGIPVAALFFLASRRRIA